MKAVVAERYGGPEVLTHGERPDPKVGPDTVLVRVAAASINPVAERFAWADVRAAVEAAETGHVRGKLVLTGSW